jgi:pimeloyl-ACP methyl ester carboxylesterase
MDGEVLEIGGCDILVERLGKGAPLVVLHGEDGPRGARPFLERLAQRFEVHAPSHAGWAGTSCAAHVTTLRDVALVAQQYVETFRRPVPVVGLSLGGWLAAEIAATSPALVERLVLVSPIGVKIGARNDRDFVDIYVLGPKEREAAYYGPRGRPALAAVNSPDFFMEKALAEHATVRYCWRPFMHDPGLKGRLQRVQAPTLLLSGAEDRFVVNPDYYARYAGLIPGARHEVIAGAGHRLEEEEPQMIADRVAAFAAAAVPA